LIVLLRQTGWMIVRQLRSVSRQPVWVGVMVVQPLIWLLLYGQLFSRVSALRAGASSYVEFLLPGIICMNAFFAGSWSGLATIDDLEHHVIDRFLAAPTARSAIILSQVLRAGIVAIGQALVLLLLGLALGVHVQHGAAGWFVVLAASALLATAFSGLSHGIALLVRREASMIAVANLIGLPLVFLSTILIPTQQMPHWIERISRFNPVDWGVRAARNGVVAGDEWSVTGGLLLLLFAATVITTMFATWCFRAYQRSI
jgi:ABC-2 type transport system permease protein